jgi:glycosyltransferase involved in cell wall biosynthesis
MIKILFLIETLSEGGAEKVLRNLVNSMDQTRFGITVQTVWPCDASKYLAAGIKYKSIYRSKNKINVKRYRAEAACGLCYRLHIREKYDIECAYLEMGPTKVMAASTNKNSKKLAWVHCDLTKAVSDPKTYAEKTAGWYSKFDKVVCVSQSVKDTFDQLFQRRFDSTVLYNVIDDSLIREKAGQPISNETEKHGLTVLSVGRFSEQKNFLRLLKAHKRLIDERIEHDLWILGDGDLRPVLEQYVNENGLQSTVWMPGFKENPYPYMLKADLLACSSNYEGYSTFLTEGVILGKPIITTDVSGMKELLGESEYGLVVSNDDNEFYKGMKLMLSNQNLRREYAEKAALKSKDLSEEKLLKITERFFEELMNR